MELHTGFLLVEAKPVNQRSMQALLPEPQDCSVSQLLPMSTGLKNNLGCDLEFLSADGF